MKEVDFSYKIADFDIDKPVIITHSDFEWDEEKKQIVRVDREHVYYEPRQNGATE